MRALVLHPPAKINLTLRVGPARPDGFHDVQTVFQSIALRDTMTFARRRGGLALRVSGGDVPADRGNLVWRAAETLWTALGRRGEPHGVAIDLRKRIPVAAGLGGGSADAAAALVGLARLWRPTMRVADLAPIAAALGSDVPFFLVGGTSLGLGRGEQLYPLIDVRPFGVVIVKPAFGVAAGDAYAWLDTDRSRGLSFPDVASAVDVGWPMGPLALANDLQGPVASRHSEIARMATAIEGVGGTALMSGSGSAVFGLFPLAAAARAARRLASRDWQVFGSRTLPRRHACRLMGLC